jgi:hypothetical protein
VKGLSSSESSKQHVAAWGGFLELLLVLKRYSCHALQTPFCPKISIVQGELRREFPIH